MSVINSWWLFSSYRKSVEVQWAVSLITTWNLMSCNYCCWSREIQNKLWKTLSLITALTAELSTRELLGGKQPNTILHFLLWRPEISKIFIILLIWLLFFQFFQFSALCSVHHSSYCAYFKPSSFKNSSHIRRLKMLLPFFCCLCGIYEQSLVKSSLFYLFSPTVSLKHLSFFPFSLW